MGIEEIQLSKWLADLFTPFYIDHFLGMLTLLATVAIALIIYLGQQPGLRISFFQPSDRTTPQDIYKEAIKSFYKKSLVCVALVFFLLTTLPPLVASLSPAWAGFLVYLGVVGCVIWLLVRLLPSVERGIASTNRKIYDEHYNPRKYFENIDINTKKFIQKVTLHTKRIDALFTEATPSHDVQTPKEWQEVFNITPELLVADYLCFLSTYTDGVHEHIYKADNDEPLRRKFNNAYHFFPITQKLGEIIKKHATDGKKNSALFERALQLHHTLWQQRISLMKHSESLEQGKNDTQRHAWISVMAGPERAVRAVLLELYAWLISTGYTHDAFQHLSDHLSERSKEAFDIKRPGDTPSPHRYIEKLPLKEMLMDIPSNEDSYSDLTHQYPSELQITLANTNSTPDLTYEILRQYLDWSRQFYSSPEKGYDHNQPHQRMLPFIIGDTNRVKLRTWVTIFILIHRGPHIQLEDFRRWESMYFFITPGSLPDEEPISDSREVISFFANFDGWIRDIKKSASIILTNTSERPIDDYFLGQIYDILMRVRDPETSNAHNAPEPTNPTADTKDAG
jgi:hypothetical protein